MSTMFQIIQIENGNEQTPALRLRQRETVRVPLSRLRLQGFPENPRGTARRQGPYRLSSARTKEKNRLEGLNVSRFLTIN